MSRQVSVVIVSWNVRECLRGCLRSVFAESAHLDLEVIVVDNDSADGSPEMIKQDFPRVRLIENATNRGFAAAVNQGLDASENGFVLVLNPDTEVLDGAIEKSMALMERQADWGVLGCQVLKTAHQVQPTCFSFPGPMNLFLIGTGLQRLFPRSRFFGRPRLSWWDRQSEQNVDVVSGMFMLVRREAIEAVGPMDEDYFVYAEEADWCYRFWSAGWKCVFSPVAQIIHVEGGGRSTSQVAVRMFVQLQKSLLIFNRKNLGRRAWLMAKLILIASSSVRAALWLTCSIWTGKRTLLRARCAAAAVRYHLTGLEPLPE